QLRAIGLYDAQKRAAEAAAARINLFNWRLERGQAEPARQVVIPAIRWHEAELKAGRGDIRLLRNLYWQYGSASRSLGKLEQAGKLYLGALGLAQRQQDKTAEAEIREELGSLYHEQKNDQASLEQYDAALQLNVALGNTQQQAFDHANAGLALAGLGQHEQAIGRFRLALPVLAAAREDEVVARVRMALGTSLEAVDRRAEALPEYQQAVALRRRLPDRTALAESLQALGTGLRHLDRDVAAVPVLEEVARLWRELGRPAEESLAANSLGAALELLDRPEDALRWRERVLQLDLSAGPQAAGDVADARRVIARSLQALGRQPEALAQLQQALDWYLAEHAAGRSTNTVALRLLYRGISDLQASLGRHADALEPRRQALALAGALGDRSGEADDLHEYGGLLGRLRQTAEAVAQFDAEIALRRALGDLPGEADANIGAAIALAMTWDEAGATARYRQAIELVRKAGDPEAEAQDRMLFGMMLRQFGHLEAARQEFATALALVAARTETELTRSAAEQGLGNLSADAGHGAEAFARYEAALRLAIAADSIGQRLRVERDIAYLAADRGDVTGAVARLRRALVLARAHDWGGQQGMARYYEADLQVQLAFRLVDQGQLDLAQQQIDAAQAVARNSGDPFLQTAALTAQGSVLLQRGRYAEAIATYESTLALPGNAGDDLLRDGVLNNVGLAQAAAGRYDAALASHLQVLQSRRARGDRWSEMISLDNLATVMLKLGQPAQAEQFAIEGQALAAQLESRDYEARLRRSQADARARLGRIDEARADYRASVRIARSVGIPEVEADGWLGSGYLERDHGRPAAAIDAFARALERYRRAGVRYGEAEALASLAALEAGRGRAARARAYAQQALALAGEIGAPDLLWRCWDALAVTAERQGQVEQAIFYRKQAVNAVQGLRAGLTRLDKELQRSLLDDKAPVYRGLADDLIGLGRLAEAEQVMAMLKEEEYFDFVRRDAASDARRTTLPASAGEAPWAQRYAAISDRVVALGQEYQSLRAIPAEQRTPEQQARFAAVKADLDVARAAFNAYLADIDQAFKAEGGQRRDAYAAQNLDSLRAQQATLDRLGAGAVLVHYL
ncbi:MAG: tetratricopeptide repeat protein, partial [Steroidobacteraceae bacterium]|nr:tetratricopeptide repeat protein [Steroidobacteraceae bacterium]